MAKPDDPSPAELAQRRIVGERIRTLREEAAMSQMDLAGKAGLHRPHLGLIERGETNPTLDTLVKVATALGVKVKDLFGN